MVPKKVETMMGVPFSPKTTVRVGLIGAGARDQSLLRDLLLVPGVAVTAVCDIDPRRVEQALKRCGEAYVCGDMSGGLLRTARGRTILLQHDVVSPPPALHPPQPDPGDAGGLGRLSIAALPG
jgi:hypothetical protein